MDRLCTLKNVFKEIYKFEQFLQKELGLSINEIMILCTLSGGRFTSSALAKELGVSSPRMSKIIAELEEKGLVKRRMDEGDRRKVVLALTIKGKRKLICVKDSSISFPQIKVVRKKKKIDMINVL